MKYTITTVLCFFALATHASAGPVQSQACPFSCRTEGIPKQYCRDWREGDRCFVEDNRPGARYDGGPRGRYGPMASSGVDAECRYSRGLPEPRVEISDIRHTGSELGDKIRIRGTIEGACLTEAGLFERGREAERIPISGTRDFRRYDFEVTTHRREDPEIRVYNSEGDRDILPINDLERNGGRARYNPEADLLGNFADRLSGR